MADDFCLKMPDFHVTFKDLLHAVNLRHGTNGLTSFPKEGVLRIFSPSKIRRLRSGLNPKGQHGTCRPPKPLLMYLIIHHCLCIGFIDVNLLPEDDRVKSKQVGVNAKLCVKKYNLNISAFVDFIV